MFSVFREWINRWARRLIIKSCIVAMREDIQSLPQTASKYLPVPAPTSSAALVHPELPLQSLHARLLRLDPLARFVVVLRMLEKYSRRETALLLGVDERICDVALEAATEKLAAAPDAGRSPFLRSLGLGGRRTDKAFQVAAREEELVNSSAPLKPQFSRT